MEVKDQPFLPGYFNASSAFVRNKKYVKEREVPTEKGENNQRQNTDSRAKDKTATSNERDIRILCRILFVRNSLMCDVGYLENLFNDWQEDGFVLHDMHAVFSSGAHFAVNIGYSQP